MNESGLKCEDNLDQIILEAPIDREAFTKIVSNLLNNAVKYACRQIRIILSADTDHFICLFSMMVLRLRKAIAVRFSICSIAQTMPKKKKVPALDCPFAGHWQRCTMDDWNLLMTKSTHISD